MIVSCYPPQRLKIKRGKGSWVWDTSGKRYLDFTGGIAVNALGYGDKPLVRSARKQLRNLIHCSNLYSTEAAEGLAQEMVSYQPFNGRTMHAVFFSNSGMEANEAALKFAACFSNSVRDGTPKFASLTGSFHGRSLLTLSLSANRNYSSMYGRAVPDSIQIPLNQTSALHRKLNGSVAAIIIEVIQGEGGMRTMNAEFATVLNRICYDSKILIIADEIQSGVGRTGRFYASEWVGLKPDIITLAKPLGGGLPLGATLVTKRVNAQLSPGVHGSTFGGGPVQCAMAQHIWKHVLNQSFLEEVQEKGQVLGKTLEQFKARFSVVQEVRGMGLLQGIFLAKSTPVAKIIAAAQDAGLLLLRSGTNVLRIAPPLTISKSELEAGLGIIEQLLQNARRSNG